MEKQVREGLADVWKRLVVCENDLSVEKQVCGG